MEKHINIEFPVWWQCNNRCEMCSNATQLSQEIPPTLEELKQLWQEKIKNIDQSLLESVSITGGEPTLNNDLHSFIDYIIETVPNISINLITNGRRLAYWQYARSFLKYKNNRFSFLVALHGDSDNIHEQVTKSPKSFDQAVLGISNVCKLKKYRSNIFLEVRTVLSRYNYQNLVDTCVFVSNKWGTAVDQHVLIYVKYIGYAIKNKQDVFLSYSQLQPQLKLLSDFKSKVKDLRLYHFPLCVVPPKLWPKVWRSLGDHEVKFLEQCQDCQVKDYCLGVIKGYLIDGSPEDFKSIQNIRGELQSEKGLKLKTSDNYYNPIVRVDE